MLKRMFEDKSAATTPDPMQPWQLTDSEREQLSAAKADVELKRRAAMSATAGTQEAAIARDELRFARLHLDSLKDQLRRAVQRRLTPVELRED